MDHNKSPYCHNHQENSELLKQADPTPKTLEPEIHGDNKVSASISNILGEYLLSPSTNSTSRAGYSFSSILQCSSNKMDYCAEPQYQLHQNDCNTSSSVRHEPPQKRLCQRGTQSNDPSLLGMVFGKSCSNFVGDLTGQLVGERTSSSLQAELAELWERADWGLPAMESRVESDGRIAPASSPLTVNNFFIMGSTEKKPEMLLTDCMGGEVPDSRDADPNPAGMLVGDNPSVIFQAEVEELPERADWGLLARGSGVESDIRIAPASSPLTVNDFFIMGSTEKKPEMLLTDCMGGEVPDSRDADPNPAGMLVGDNPSVIFQAEVEGLPERADWGLLARGSGVESDIRIAPASSPLTVNDFFIMGSTEKKPEMLLTDCMGGEVPDSTAADPNPSGTLVGDNPSVTFQAEVEELPERADWGLPARESRVESDVCIAPASSPLTVNDFFIMGSTKKKPEMLLTDCMGGKVLDSRDADPNPAGTLVGDNPSVFFQAEVEGLPERADWGLPARESGVESGIRIAPASSPLTINDFFIMGSTEKKPEMLLTNCMGGEVPDRRAADPNPAGTLVGDNPSVIFQAEVEELPERADWGLPERESGVESDIRIAPASSPLTVNDFFIMGLTEKKPEKLLTDCMGAEVPDSRAADPNPSCNLVGASPSLFLQEDSAKTPNRAYWDLPAMECMVAGNTHAAPRSSLLRAADNSIFSPGWNDEILLAQCKVPKSQILVSYRSPPTLSNDSISTEPKYLSQALNRNMNLHTLSPPIAEGKQIRYAECTATVLEGLLSQIPSSSPVNAADIAVIAYQRHLSSLEQQVSLPSVQDSTLALSSDIGGKSSIYSAGTAQWLSTTGSGTSYNEAEQNQVGSFTGGKPNLTRRLLVQKYLTGSDIETNVTGILLPKANTRARFPHVGDKGLEMKMHDQEEEGRIWIMRLVKVLHTTGRVYRLKDSLKFILHHSLKEKDLLQIIQQDGLYVLRFKRYQAEYISAFFEHTHTGGRTWRSIFVKIITVADAKLGPQSVGSISLGKTEVETNFPFLQDKNGVRMTFYDWNVKRTWVMTLKFSPHAKGRLYRLQDTAKFSRSYALKEGDMIAILSSDEIDVKYALKVSKPLE